jgi:6-phospho-beta-glucosidase
MRLVVVGGSGSSTPELVDALEDWPGGVDRRPPMTVALVGRTTEKLEVVAAECRARVRLPGPPLEIETATDRRRALEGADVVLDQVRVGGLAARVFDESFPWEFGLPGEETTGPGGFANALRTVPARRGTWADIRASAPGAVVIDLTNPAGIVQQAAEREGGFRIVAVCDAPATFTRAIAVRLGRPVSRVVRRYVGTNHCGWYVPESPDEMDALADLVVGMDPSIVRLHGAVPSPYVRYYVNPDRMLDAQRGHETRARVLQRIDAELLAGYAAATGEAAAQRGALRRGALRRGALWYPIAVVPFLDALVHGTDEPIILGVRNDGRVPGVPDPTIVEVPHVAPRPGEFVALEAAPLPPLPSLLLAQVGTYETLTVDALVPGAPPEARLRALIANPLVRDADRAAALLAAIDAGSPVA